MYNIDNCDVKLFVAATPISGPQFNPIANDDCCERDEFSRFTIDNIFAFDSLAIFTASNTSALSPLCEIVISVELGSISFGENGNSLEINVFILIFANFDMRYFVISAAL